MASSLLQMHKESQNEEPPPGNSPKPPPLRSSEGELDAGLAACGLLAGHDEGQVEDVELRHQTGQRRSRGGDHLQ